MPERQSKGNLRVIAGGGVRSGTPDQSFLELVKLGDPSVFRQLPLPGVLPEASVITVEVRGPGYEDLFDTARHFGAKLIVDVRLSPTFHGDAHKDASTLDRLKSGDIQYVWMPDLGNHFVGESLNDASILHRYSEYLSAKCGKQLTVLRKQVDHGPVLILFWRVPDGYSERSVLIKALADVAPGFYWLTG